MAADQSMQGKCGAKTRSNGKCGRPAGWGTSHAGVGRCKNHGGASPNGEKAAAKEFGVIMGAALDVEPHDALLQCVRQTAGEVAYMTSKVRELESPTVSTMFGPQLQVWVVERQRATDRLAKYSKMALDAGVAERQVRVAEQAGEQIAGLLQSVFEQLGLTADQQRRAPAIVQGAMRELEASVAA